MWSGAESGFNESALVEGDDVSPSLKPNPTLFEKRTLVVWSALFVSMTSVGGLLLMMEPLPIAPASGVVLTSLDGRLTDDQALFSTRHAPTSERWRSVVIHFSGEQHGNARTLARLHQAEGSDGLRYHFVIGNGDGAGDGAIQVGHRWSQQLDADHRVGDRTGAWYDQHAIAVCLIGDADRHHPTEAQMRQLARLVVALQDRLQIPAHRVLQISNISAGAPVRGLLFPASSLRSQLLSVSN